MFLSRLSTLGLAAAVGLAVYALGRAGGRKGYGSPIYASRAADAPELRPDATPEEVLDAGIEYTFPASDPVSVESAYRFAAQRQGAS